MSNDQYTCAECGERAIEILHNCPGSPPDRLASLESRVEDLEEQLKWLRQLIGGAE